MISYNILKANEMINKIIYKEKITYKKLSKILGVSQTFLYYFRRQKRISKPLYDKIEKLFYKLEQYYLIGYIRQSKKILYFYEIYESKKAAKNELNKYKNSSSECDLKILTQYHFTERYKKGLLNKAILFGKKEGYLIINFNNVYQLVNKKIIENKK